MAWAEKLLLLYHRLPYPLKVLTASLQGYGLRWRRYGAETERLVEEALARESWTAAQWQAWQGERLARVLSRAATQVPYYREQWALRRRRGDRASWEYLENWPILEKEPLRAHPRAFVAEDCNTKRMICLPYQWHQRKTPDLMEKPRHRKSLLCLVRSAKPQVAWGFIP